jgi:hypothetical protein
MAPPETLDSARCKGMETINLAKKAHPVDEKTSPNKRQAHAQRVSNWRRSTTCGLNPARLRKPAPDLLQTSLACVSPPWRQERAWSPIEMCRCWGEQTPARHTALLLGSDHFLVNTSPQVKLLTCLGTAAPIGTCWPQLPALADNELSASARLSTFHATFSTRHRQAQ